ncbi:ligand-binding sensor domain-containing protein [Hymenobacter sp. UYAg731]
MFSPRPNWLFPRLHLVLLGLLLLGSVGTAPARPRPRYAVAGHEKPVALLHAGKATYLITAHSVFRLEGAEFVRKAQVANIIQCAALADTALWLGTQAGVLRLNTATYRPRPVALPGTDAMPGITALFRDGRGAVWVGANGAGVFRWDNGSFTQELRTPAINGGVATADSSIWIATSIGLSRKQGAEWTRYNEEGVANHEIPDNIVEKLLPDNAGNLWVVMSDAVCVFEGGGQRGAAEAELPTVKFLGRPGNELFGVASLPGTGRLFATTDGLLLLPNEPGGFASFTPATDKIEPKRLLRPLPPLPGAGKPILLEVDQQQRLWLASEEGVTVLTAKEFRRFAQAQAVGKALAGHLTP